MRPMQEQDQIQVKRAKTSPGLQPVFVVVAGVLLALIAAIGALFLFENAHAARVYSGVHVAGIDLSKLSLGDATARLNSDLSYPRTGQLLLTDGGNKWFFAPEALGYSNNTIRSADAAFQLGRQGSFINKVSQQLQAAGSGINLDPVVTYDQSLAYKVLQGIATQIDRPVLEAGIALNGAEVSVTEGQLGRQLDITASLKAIEAVMHQQNDGVIPLVVTEVPPAVMDVSASAEQARQILSAPLTLLMPDGSAEPGPWTLPPNDIAKLLIISHAQPGAPQPFEISINAPALTSYLNSIAPGIYQAPKNARMFFNEERGELEVTQNATIGRSLDIEATVQQISDQLSAGQHEIALVMKNEDPLVKDDTTAASLGITQLVHSETSYFYGSDPARIQNIRASSESFNGVMVPPNSVFSMADYLTDISLENGYAEALIIVGDQTVKGVGGGVCQVSTTLFRAAFFAGYPIVERHAHAYRVYYYEQRSNGGNDPNLAGLDATVFVPLVDFKFRNDTDNWILMQTEMTDSSLTWKFYSTYDGRTVDWSTTGVTNVVSPPDPVYRENPDLAEGQIRQVDWAVDGADVTVTRYVYRDGQVITSDNISTHFVAWPNAFDYGPGTEIPGE